MFARLNRCAVFFVSIAAVAAAGCSSDGPSSSDAAPIDGQVDQSRDSSAGSDATDASTAPDGRVEPAWGCPFPYTIPQSRTLTGGEMGTVMVRDVHVRCRITIEDSAIEVLVKAIATKMGPFTAEYEAQEAFSCQEGVVNHLEEFSFSLDNRHGWQQMEATIDDRIYRFDYSDTCVGSRPCTPFFDEVDILDAKTNEPLDEGLSVICAGVGDGGVPHPLVAQHRIGMESGSTQLFFSMGSTEGDPDEAPVHELQIVTVRVDKRETTNADMALFLTDHGNDCDGHSCVVDAEPLKVEKQGKDWKAKPGFAGHPVVQVTWHGAKAYCRWRQMSLPSEVEWEAAASAVGKRRYPWGDEAPSCDRAVYDSCGSSSPALACSATQGHSAEGICDLSGNVAEWILDWYKSDFYEICDGSQSFPCWQGPFEGTLKVVRGGSFALPVHNLRAADRSSAAPDSASADIGLRCISTNPS